MKVLNLSINNTPQIQDDLCACIGYFDGFHKGHQGLFNATMNAKKKYGYKAAIITFEPDPWSILKNIKDVEHLMGMSDRQKLAEELGFDYFIILDFDRSMADLEPEVFIDQLLLPINIKYLVCGFDFHFGTHGKGDSKFLTKLNKFMVEEIPAITYDGDKISSTRITDCIENGNIELANILLTRPFKVSGEVVHGKAIGRTYGFPTANIKLNDLYIKPMRGVYAGKITIGGNQHICIINVGYNPTFNLVDKLSIEAYILDFNQDIYGEIVSLEFYKFLRPEAKFSGVEELVNVLKKNAEEARAYFTELNHA